MKKLLDFMKKKYVWATTMAVIMSLSSTYTMLDAFVIPKSITTAQASTANYTTAVQNQNKSTASQTNSSSPATAQSTDKSSADTAATSQSSATATDYSYKDDNISINVEKVTENGSVFYVADVQVSDVNYLKTALANNTYGKNITQTTSAMAKANNAIFAINGDYYGFRDTGLIIRNGILYRDVARKSPDNKALIINSKGELQIVTEGTTSGKSLVSSGILQSFSFGPVLVENGKVSSVNSTMVSQSANPRTAIGQISPLHYIFIVADGRTNTSKGLTLAQLAQEFVERGATVAYNLDGGGSSAMWLNGKLINNPTDGRSMGERSVSDILYIGK